METKSEVAKKLAGTSLESILAAVKVGGRRWVDRYESRPCKKTIRKRFTGGRMCGTSCARGRLEHLAAIFLSSADLVARISSTHATAFPGKTIPVAEIRTISRTIRATGLLGVGTQLLRKKRNELNEDDRKGIEANEATEKALEVRRRGSRQR